MKLVLMVMSGLSVMVMVPLFVSIDHRHTSNCFPDHDVEVPINSRSSNGMAESDFEQIMDEFIEVFGDNISKEYNRKLVIHRKWGNSTVNAFAYQNSSRFEITMNGGLARHEAMDLDSVKLVVCHELGHHIGGSPKKVRFWSNTPSWASNEGQSDYWAATKCFRELLIEGNKIGHEWEAPLVDDISNEDQEFALKNCKISFSDDLDIEACTRTAHAAIRIGRMFMDLRNLSGQVSIKTPSSAIVSSTDHKHPKPQCRVDTYYQGGLCELDYQIEVSNDDYKEGLCYKEKHDIGLRPSCWFNAEDTGGQSSGFFSWFQ